MSDEHRSPGNAHDLADWDPRAADVAADQRAAYDAMRSRCPVARDLTGGWTLFRHADVVRVLHDCDGFSNVVSRHISVPNGMDPPTRTVFRRLIEPYFNDGLVAAFRTRLSADCSHPGRRRVRTTERRCDGGSRPALCRPGAVCLPRLADGSRGAAHRLDDPP